jgi:hypothetical protein
MSMFLMLLPRGFVNGWFTGVARGGGLAGGEITEDDRPSPGRRMSGIVLMLNEPVLIAISNLKCVQSRRALLSFFIISRRALWQASVVMRLRNRKALPYDTWYFRVKQFLVPLDVDGDGNVDRIAPQLESLAMESLLKYDHL